MLVLVVDTSSPQVLAALVRLDKSGHQPIVHTYFAPLDARRHGELLAGGVDRVLRGRRPDAVVAGTGPGPFTGLRVGLMTAAALADAWQVPAHGVCSLDGVALPRRACLVVTDARRREVYWARYDLTGRRVDGPHVQRPDELASSLASDGTLLCGAGAGLYPEVFAGCPVAAERLYPDAASLAGVAGPQLAAGEPGPALTPHYLRRPDAVVPGAPKRVTEPAPRVRQ